MELGTRRRRPSSEPGPAGGADYLSALPDDLLLVLARVGCAAAAARTGLLARRWRGLWARLRDLAFRDVAFPLLQAALGRIALPPPAVSLLEICFSDEDWPIPGVGAVKSLLRAAALVAPEKLVFAFPWGPEFQSTDVELPCFHRATSIALEWIPFVLRAPAAGGEFPALQTLSLTGCQVDGLGALLSLCPHLSVLRLKFLIWPGDDDYDDPTTVHSASLQELVMEHICTNRVDIVAPILKQLTLSLCAKEQVSISILAPMIENVSWEWLYDHRTIGFGRWTLQKLSLQTAETQGQLTSLHIHACNYWFTSPDEEADEEANFAQEIEKHMVVDFSALELHLTTNGHGFGAFVSRLLGFNRIRGVIRRLKIVRVPQGTWEEQSCPAYCTCESMEWRTQIISLTALEDLEIDGFAFKAEDPERDFLKLIFRSAPILKTVTVKLSTGETNTNIYDIFRGYNVYLSSGKYSLRPEKIVLVVILRKKPQRIPDKPYTPSAYLPRSSLAGAPLLGSPRSFPESLWSSPSLFPSPPRCFPGQGEGSFFPICSPSDAPFPDDGEPEQALPVFNLVHLAVDLVNEASPYQPRPTGRRALHFAPTATSSECLILVLLVHFG